MISLAAAHIHYVTSSGTNYASDIYRWLTGGGLTALLYGVFRYGNKSGGSDTRMNGLEEDIKDVKDDIRDVKNDVREVRAALYGFVPRSRYRS